MMNLYRRNSGSSFARAGSGRRRLFAATALLVLLVILDSLTGGSVRNLARAGGASVWTASQSINRVIFGSGFFKTRRSLANENAALRAQVATMQEKSAAYSVLVAENEALRAFVSLPDMRGSERGVTAPVVSSLSSSPYGTFLIGAGSDEGVAVNSLVVSSENFVIGEVVDVSTHTSLVAELFAPDNAVEASIGGVVATANGRGGGNAHVRLPRESGVTVGDPVISRDFGGRPIGVVGKVEADPGGAFTDVFIRVPVNLDSVRFVYVIAP